MTQPRKDNPPTLGESREQALRRLRRSERSLTRRGELDEFQKGIQEYDAMRHSEKVPVQDLGKPQTDVFYFPMHGVTKDSTTTK